MPPVQTLGVAEILRFLTAKGIRPLCPACGANEFDSIDPSSARVGPGGGAARRIPILALGCRNCATILFYRRHIVAQWIADHPTN